MMILVLREEVSHIDLAFFTFARYINDRIGVREWTEFEGLASR